MSEGANMSKKEDLSKLDSLESCPICDKKLERGYVITPGIRWDTQKHVLAIGSARRLGSIPWTLNNFPSLKCGTCGIVIIDYGSGE
ncbi:hypothetical protein GTO27_04350 [Candidatus Bathyarchaeota archaeon]|nr:hypothetical protein [Candidatus Bathyarchaeota archaeon]